MSRVTLGATGSPVASTTYEMRVTLGQEGLVGAASRCNDGYHHTGGFWSMLGDQPVPTLILVARDPAVPGGVILSWSGSASQFEIYRSTIPASIADPGNFVRTVFACTAPDAPPTVPELFYEVLPAGP